MLYANCHNHSTYSDGVLTPCEILQKGKTLGHRALLLTDHDTVRGIPAFLREARLEGIQSLVACEFSSRTVGVPFHILGIDFDPEDRRIREILENGQRKQRERSRLLLEFAYERGEVREGLSMEEAMDAFPGRDYFYTGTIVELALKKGVYTEEDVSLLREALRSNPQREARIKEINGLKYPDGEDVVRAIVKAGGVAVAAHPAKDFACIKPLLSAGLKGVEVRHPDCTPEQNAECLRLCEEMGLYRLGGTDHSGPLCGYGKPYCDVPPERGYVTEEEFTALYERKMG